MKYGLIGEHLGHSYSCEIHAAIADYEYELTELRPDELKKFFQRREFRGINVTIPYKQAVMPYLDEISEKAKEIGAVNTVINRNGKLYGYNTDYAGMRALAERIGIRACGKKILILGTGGTSKTALAVARNLGAAEVIRVSRKKQEYNTPEEGETGGTQAATDSPLSGCAAAGYGSVLSYEEALERHADAEIIFNTTPAGMYPETDGQAVSLSTFTRLEAVLDVVYNPLRTNLILEAQARGIPAEGGLYMLSAQGAAASALFRGFDLRGQDTEKAFQSVLLQKRNVVLIGMPSSGKTSVGRQLADKTGLAFQDTDEIVVRETEMSVSDYFMKYGEPEFRSMESRVIRELSQTGGQIIATGGGAILNPCNIQALKRKGILVFLDRSPEKLLATADRPLSSDREALMRRYRERYELYCKAADIRVPGDGSVAETADLVYRKTER